MQVVTSNKQRTTVIRVGKPLHQLLLQDTQGYQFVHLTLRSLNRRLTFRRRIFFFQILAHSVFKM